MDWVSYVIRVTNLGILKLILYLINGRKAWYAGWNSIPPCILDSQPHIITSNKRRINTVVSPDDGHRVARNM
jgi:hypothetical protein